MTQRQYVRLNCWYPLLRTSTSWRISLLVINIIKKWFIGAVRNFFAMTVASFAKIFSKKQSQKKKLRTQRNCSKKAKRKQRVKFTNIWITINYSKHIVPQYKTTKCTKSLGENEQYSINLPVIFWSRFACFDRSLCFDRNCYTQREILLSIAFFLFIAFLVRLWNSSVVYMNMYFSRDDFFAVVVVDCW